MNDTKKRKNSPTRVVLPKGLANKLASGEMNRIEVRDILTAVDKVIIDGDAKYELLTVLRMLSLSSADQVKEQLQNVGRFLALNNGQIKVDPVPVATTSQLYGEDQLPEPTEAKVSSEQTPVYRETKSVNPAVMEPEPDDSNCLGS